MAGPSGPEGFAGPLSLGWRQFIQLSAKPRGFRADCRRGSCPGPRQRL